MNIGKTGGMGESLTAQFLRKNGVNIIKRNYQCRFGEIDIIGEKDEYIIFVEVKTRRENALVSPEESVDNSKRQKIVLSAEHFLMKYKTDLQPRFDAALVTVYIKEDNTEGYKLNYIKNAF